MRTRKIKAGIAAGISLAAAAALALPGVASADTAAKTGDAVGVGSDTLQNAVNFALDGSPGTASAFNPGAVNRIVNYDATGDANGRAVYDGTCGAVTATGLGTFCDSTTNQTPNLLPGSVILREGQKPVTRPNGSGAGVAALIADSSTGYDGLPTGSLQFARMSRLPNSTEEGECPTTTATCAGLHVYQVATDNLAIAHDAASYNGPAGLSAAELVKIYNCTYTAWNQIPGNTSGSTDTIHPLIPQSGSGTRNFFLADLQTANGGTAVTPGTCVRTVEEHDPTGIYGDPTPADAIEPFSTGKIALINSGYFDSGAGYAGTGADASFTSGAYTKNFLTTLTGTAPDSTASYLSTRGLYVTLLQANVISTTPFEPGGTQNFASQFVSGGASAFRSASGKAQIAAAGFTAAYKDCGINPASC